MTSSSLTYSVGDVGLALFDFQNGRPPKARPVVVVSGEAFNGQRPEVVVAPISSKIDLIEFADFRVNDWRTAGLLAPGRVSAAVSSIPRGSIRKRLGCMAAEDLVALRSMLTQVFGSAIAPSRQP